MAEVSAQRIDPWAARRSQLMAELRRMGIADERVLAAVERTPRELFVPDTFKERAYENVPLPIGRAQTISQPYIVALMTEALALTDRHKVLEIGTGSGYQASVLARLCRRVFTVERHGSLLKEAEKRFAEQRLHNVTTRFGDGSKGWQEQGPFDRIIVTAAAADMPLRLVDQLREGGILVAPVGKERQDQQLIRIHRARDGHRLEEMGTVRFVPLVPGLPREPAGSHASPQNPRS